LIKSEAALTHHAKVIEEDHPVRVHGDVARVRVRVEEAVLLGAAAAVA
jgi:hypothetical protein